MRKKIIAGNWKMNILPHDSMGYMQQLYSLTRNSMNEVILCVPFTNLHHCVVKSQDTNIKIGAQNVYFEENGAFTGEISAQMLKSLEVEYVIIGHSERRQIFKETDDDVNKKVKTALKNGLKPIVCVGETLSLRESGKTTETIITQTKLALDGVTKAQAKELLIAYEPVWAIGTGKTASSDDANNAIASIRNELANLFGKDISEEINILYGGSVNSTNAKELFSMPEINGGLVGGASLKPNEFAKIINLC